MTTHPILAMIFSGTELLIISASLLSTAFWIWMLMDCIRRISGGDNRQMGWLIVVALTHGIGALVYFCFGRRSAATTQS